ncbi:MAG: hypothetical protein O2830_04335 [Verrucomicrobia bacterium]|nr:hypothetical protein [Verrucomicrobiota bacterium]MDA1340524.1 hypothetical protein [Verrucomicrobiota bacterium]
MNDENQSYDAPVSCAWPLVTVLGAFLLVNLVQLVSIVKERQTVTQTTTAAAQAIGRYKTVSTKLEELAKDLMRLSLTNSEAKEIVTQFNIQMNQPNAGALSPAKK